MKVKHNTYTVSQSAALLYALNRREEEQARAKKRQEMWQQKNRVFSVNPLISPFEAIQAGLAKLVYKLWKKGFFNQFPEFRAPDNVEQNQS